MPTAFLRPDARKDLDNLAEYLTRDSLEIALQFINAVGETCLQLAQSPDLGNATDFAPRRLRGLRFWRVNRFPNHLIFYRKKSYGVEVLRIIHAARDLNAIFGS